MLFVSDNLSATLCIFRIHSFQSPLDKVHKLRLAIGSGLRTDIWKRFESRYGIPWIIEYFGTTEGTAALMNLENKLGACGRLSPFLVCSAKLTMYHFMCTSILSVVPGDMCFLLVTIL